MAALSLASMSMALDEPVDLNGLKLSKPFIFSWLQAESRFPLFRELPGGAGTMTFVPQNTTGIG